MDEQMAISSEQSPHLSSPRLFQRTEVPLPFPTTHFTYIAKWTYTAGGTLPSLASTPQRQAKQSSGRDQDQPWVLTTRQFHSEEVGFLNFYLFSLGAAKTVEVAQCTFQRCLLLQSFQHPWIIQALRQYPSPAAGQLLVMISS